MNRILFHNDIAVCAQKVRLAMAEKQLAYEAKELDLRAGESHTPEYLKLNPKGVVPTLVEDGTAITESTIINEYLEDKYPDYSLRPEDPLSVSGMRRWVMKTDTGLLKTCALVSFGIAFRFQEQSRQLATRSKSEREALERRNAEGLDHPDAKKALLEYVKLLDEMDATLAQQPWLAGATFSLADCALIPYVRRLDNLALDWLWTETASRPSLADWYDRCQSRSSFETAIVTVVPGKKIEFMRGHGKEARFAVERILGQG